MAGSPASDVPSEATAHRIVGLMRVAYEESSVDRRKRFRPNCTRNRLAVRWKVDSTSGDELDARLNARRGQFSGELKVLRQHGRRCGS